MGSPSGVSLTGSALGSQCKEESTGNRDNAKISRNPCGSAHGADFCCPQFAQLGAPRGLTLREGPSGQRAGRFAGSDPTGPLVGRRDSVGFDSPIYSGMTPQLEEREGCPGLAEFVPHTQDYPVFTPRTILCLHLQLPHVHTRDHPLSTLWTGISCV